MSSTERRHQAAGKRFLGRAPSEADVQASAHPTFFAGNGEMDMRARTLDWEDTSLGPVACWPQSLRTAAAVVLASGFPGILLWGSDLVQLYNDAYIPFLGAKHPTALGMPAAVCWPEAWSLVAPVLDRVRSGETVTLSDQRYPLQRGGSASAVDEVYITLCYLPVRNEVGRVDGVIVTGVDTTAQVERDRLEAERSRLMSELAAQVARAEQARVEAEIARERADLANRAKGDFLAVISHELRTPLTAIGGYTELMQMGLRGPVTTEQLQDLGQIERSQRHLLHLINQVLDHTRVEVGAARYDFSDVGVGAALSDAEGLIIPLVRSRGLMYRAGSCDPALQVRADRDKLRQILLNLMTNAVKFTDHGGTITVECASRGGEVAIVVADNGIGIPPEKLACVFEPFVQVRSDLTRDNTGLGLGLAISRDLARAMGGELTATSTVGEGSKFTLTLPIAGDVAGRRSPG